MIELFPAAQTDFSKLGIALHPSVCTVYQEAGGRYDANITIPYNENGEHLLPQQDMILRIPVPPHTIGPIDLGTVSYYVTTASTQLYTKLGYSERITYDTWTWHQNYTAGTLVTYNRQNYKCLTSHNSSTDGMIPGRETHTGANVWQTVSNYRTVNPKSAGTLASGTQLQKLADVNKDYALFATTSGANGYVLLSKVEATGSSTSRTIARRDITKQLFRIDQVTLNLANRTVQIHAMHISYDMERKPLSSCVLYDATPQTALAFLQGAMLADDDRLLATDIDDTTVTVDWSWLNSLNAIMAPNDGLVALTHGKLIRDDADVFILSNGSADPVYEIRYGANMRGVNWKRDTGKIYTRVYPKGKDANGNDLFLPEGYIATSGAEPVIRTQILQVDAQVGQQIEKPDGSVIKLTESDVITLLREAATERFTKDLCDQAVTTLEVEFLFLGDTEEYSQYKGLEALHLYDYVRVTDTPDGLDQVAQVTGYRWDALRLRYERVTVGNPHDYASAGVSGYQLGTGSVSLRSLSADVIARLQGQSSSGGGSNLSALMDQVIQVATDTNNNITSIALEVSRATEAEGALGSRISLAEDAISLKVSQGDVATELAVELGNVTISGGNLVVSGYVKASELAADIANISQVSMQSFDAPTGRVNTLDIALITGTEVSVQEVNYNEGSAGDLTVTSSLTVNGTSITPSGLVADIGPATASGGQITIPFSYADGSNGTPITFNIADTAFYQQAVAAARLAGYNVGYTDARPESISPALITLTSAQTGISTRDLNVTQHDGTVEPFTLQVDASAVYDAGVAAATNATTALASIAYNSTTHRYTASASARVDGTEVDTDSATGGLEAYNAGYANARPSSISPTLITLTSAQTGVSTRDVTVTAVDGTTYTYTQQVDASSVYTAGQNSIQMLKTWGSSGTATIARVTSGGTINNIQITVTAAAGISYNSSAHTYTATAQASADSAVRASDSTTSGTDAYDDGVTAGAAGVTISRVQNNSGSFTIYNDSSGSLTVSVYVRLSNGASETRNISVSYRCID